MNNSAKFYILFTTLLFSQIVVWPQNQADTTQAPFKSSSSTLTIGMLIADSIPAFLQRINTFGTIPPQSPFGFLDYQLEKHFKPKKNTHLRLSLLGHIRGILSESPKIILPEASLITHYKAISFSMGRRKEVIGLGDTLMTSGFYSMSGNSIPIPKVQISSQGFIPLKFTHNLLSINFSIGHGWFGKQDFAQNYFLHQKTFFLKFTIPSGRLSISGGISHFVQWGGQAPLLIGKDRTGPNGELPSSLKDFWYVFTAKKFPQSSSLTNFDNENRVGNHLGSIDFLVNFKGKSNVWKLYLQHPAENLPGVFSNFPDGLYGFSWQNTRKNVKNITLTNAIIEHLTTLDQGLFFNTIINGYQGNGYFNNSQYMDGWTYKSNVIGTPFLLTRFDTRSEWYDILGSYKNGDYWKINGNSVSMWHVGLKGALSSSIHFTLKLVSSNYFFDLQPNGKYLKDGHQLNAYFSIEKSLKKLKGVTLTTSFALDRGTILPSALSNISSIKWYIPHR